MKKILTIIILFSIVNISHSQTAEDFYNQGLKLFSESDFVGAKSSFSKAIELKPDFTDAYYNLGILHYDMSEYKEALECFSKVIDLNKNDAKAYFYRGRCKDQLAPKQYGTNGIPDIKKGLELNRESILEICNERVSTYNNDSSYYLRAMIYSYLNQYEACIEDLSTAIKLNPYVIMYFCARSFSYFMTGDLKNAKLDIEKALGIDNQFPVALLYEAMILLKEEKFKKALGKLNNLINSNPQYADAYLIRCGYYYQTEDYEKAYTDILTYMKLKPDIDKELEPILKQIKSKL